MLLLTPNFPIPQPLLQPKSRFIYPQILRRSLQKFPPRPGACAVMSAMWAAFLRDSKQYPVHAVAGVLSLNGVPMFGQTDRDYSTEFAGVNLDWDGHVWITFGELIGDISLFRTAYSVGAPERLKERVIEASGQGRGLLATAPFDFANLGLEYEPKYVLTDDQISRLMRGAAQIIEENTGKRGPPEH